MQASEATWSKPTKRLRTGGAGRGPNPSSCFWPHWLPARGSFFAGSFVLVSLALARFVSPWFLLMTAFVGANLLQSSLTSFCPLTILLRAFGVRNQPPAGVAR